MQPDTSEPGRQESSEGSTSARATTTGQEPVDPGPEHDHTTSREAFEREMAEQGRTDEAGLHGDHIE